MLEFRLPRAVRILCVSTRTSISFTTQILFVARVMMTGQKMGMEAVMMAMLTSRTEKMYTMGTW